MKYIKNHENYKFFSIIDQGIMLNLGAFFAVKPQKTGLCGAPLSLRPRRGRFAPLQSLARPKTAFHGVYPLDGFRPKGYD
jgi:hypothetical protein